MPTILWHLGAAPLSTATAELIDLFSENSTPGTKGTRRRHPSTVTWCWQRLRGAGSQASPATANIAFAGQRANGIPLKARRVQLGHCAGGWADLLGFELMLAENRGDVYAETPTTG